MYLRLDRVGDDTPAVLLCDAYVAAGGSSCQTHHSAHITEVLELSSKLELDIVC